MKSDSSLFASFSPTNDSESQSYLSTDSLPSICLGDVAIWMSEFIYTYGPHIANGSYNDECVPRGGGN